MITNWEEEEQIKAEVEEHIAGIITALNLPIANIDSTAERIARMYMQDAFVASIYGEAAIENLTKENYIPNCEENPSMIIIRDIPFSSFCEHHFLPFFGTVDIGYVPNGCLLGLSKFPAIVKGQSAKPQVQEHLTTEIAYRVYDLLVCNYACARIKATHTCVSCRGDRTAMVTETFSDFSNKNEDKKEYRQEFFTRLGV